MYTQNNIVMLKVVLDPASQSQTSNEKTKTVKTIMKGFLNLHSNLDLHQKNK